MKFILPLLLAFALPFFSFAKNETSTPIFGKQVSQSGIKHSFLICGNKTVLLNENSEIVWQTEGYGRDGFILPNGHILVSVGNVAKEITRK
ncbi:hypothetical protein N9N55_02465 [Opitutales bacterium]|nr:hypothetical protein [Opitutales bacterium]